LGAACRERPSGANYNFTAFDENTLASLYEQLVRNIVAAGFETIVLLTGHFPSKQMRMLRHVVESVILPAPLRILMLAEYELVKDIGYTGGHAGKWETSIMMYLFPDLVQLELLPVDKPFEEFECIRGIDPRGAASYEVGKEIVARLASVVEMGTSHSTRSGRLGDDR